MTEERPLTTVYDCSTGIEETRPMTDEEWSAHQSITEQSKAQMEEIKTQREAQDVLRTSAKAKLIAGTPLTEEEAAILVI